MTISELSTILVKILGGCEYASVTLPSMGTFAVEHMPSQIVNEGNTITPPSCCVVFDSSKVGHNESIDLIVGEYVALRGLSADKAEEELLSLVKDIKHKLLDASYVEFPGFGVVKFSDESHFVFEPDPHFDPAAEYYGLEPLALKVVNDVPEVSEGGDVNGKCKEQEVSGKVVDMQESVAEIRPSVGSRGFPLALSVVLAVVLLLVILVLVVVLFKDELMPLLERLLYSKEELQFLKENGLQ